MTDTQTPQPIAVEQGAAINADDRAAAKEWWQMWDGGKTQMPWSLQYQFALHRHRLAERARLTTDRSVGAVPEGWKLVPVEAWQPMLNAACDYYTTRGGEKHFPLPGNFRWHAVWDAMLAATPPVPAISGEGEKLREARGRGTAFAKLNNWLDDHGYAGSLADLRAVRGDQDDGPRDRRRREAYSRLWNILGDNSRTRSDLNLVLGDDL